MPALEKASASRVEQPFLVVSANKTFGVIEVRPSRLKTSDTPAMLKPKSAEEFTISVFALRYAKVQLLVC